MGGGGLSTCSVRSRSLYDFRGGQVVVDVAQAAVDSASTRLRLQVGPGWFVEMAAEFGRLVARKSEGATIAMETPPAFDAQADRFWRLSEAGGRVEWATSPDGQAWKVLHTDTWMLPLDRFEVILGIVVEEGAPPAEARFDNLNPRPAARPE